MLGAQADAIRVGRRQAASVGLQLAHVLPHLADAILEDVGLLQVLLAAPPLVVVEAVRTRDVVDGFPGEGSGAHDGPDGHQPPATHVGPSVRLLQVAASVQQVAVGVDVMDDASDAPLVLEGLVLHLDGDAQVAEIGGVLLSAFTLDGLVGEVLLGQQGISVAWRVDFGGQNPSFAIFPLF